MKRITFVLAALAALAWSSSVAHASGLKHWAGHGKVTLVSHHGHYAHAGYGYGHHARYYRGSYPCWHSGSPDIYPRSYHYGYRPTYPYPTYRTYRPYYCAPGWGVHYYGPHVGFSFGF